MSRDDRFEPQHPEPKSGDAELIRASIEALEASVEQLPPGVDSRLRAARRDALERARTASPWTRPGRIGVAASALLLIAAVALLRPMLDAELEPLPSIYADATQQQAAEELDLLEQLEFLAWLELHAEGDDAS